MASIAGGVGPVILFSFLVLSILIIILILAYRYKTPEVGVGGRVTCEGLAPPGNLKAVGFQTTNVRLTWNIIGEAREYKIFVGTISNVQETTAIETYLVPGNTTSYVVNNLVLGRTYYFKMKTINSCGAASIFSGEVSAFIGFPPIFRIVSREQPSLGLRVGNNLTDVELAPFCSGAPGNTRCLWSYDSDTGYISSIDTPGLCMTGKPNSENSEVTYSPCSELSFSFFQPYGIWNYQAQEGSFCHNDVGNGQNCVRIAPDNVNLLTTAFNGETNMKWDIVEFND